MKAWKKYFVISLIFAFITVGTSVYAMNNPEKNNFDFRPLPPPAKKEPWYTCLHFPHSKKDADDPKNMPVISMEIAVLAEENVPLNLLQKGTVSYVFIEVAAEHSFLCFFDPPSD